VHKNKLQGSLKTVFWDFDNTLVETRDLHWQKHKLTCQSLGLDLSDNHRDLIYRNNGPQNWQWLHNNLGLSVPEADYLSRVDQWFQQNLNTVKLRAGIAACLQMFAQQDIPQAIVSNGRKKSILPILDTLSITKYFSFVHSSEDYKSRKPDPTPYLSALSRMNIEHQLASACLAIEDDPAGVQSAKTAGCVTIHYKLEDLSPHADYTVQNDQELIDLCRLLAG
jgi:HAD superfamily hydrolase (TIGR01509 family)